MKGYGSQSETGKIEKVLIKHPRDAFIDQAQLDAQWRQLNYLDCPNFHRALDEYNFFEDLLKREIPEIFYLPRNTQTGLDSIYTHDPVVMTDQGAILCQMGKADRQGEPAAVGDYCEDLGIPILGSIEGEGRLEGGDTVWLDGKTLVVGHGYRTNQEGIRQLQELTESFVDELIVVPLPHWQGPKDVLHLMSLISPIDENLAVVYSRLMSVPFREILLRRGMKLVEVPDNEYETMGCNVLTVAPRKCIMLAGNPRTRQLLESEGVEVWEYDGDEISRKGAGGPTCLTRPLLRLN